MTFNHHREEIPELSSNSPSARPRSTETQSETLHQQAERCRRLAEATYDRRTHKLLGDMAEGFEHTADQISKPGDTRSE